MKIKMLSGLACCKRLTAPGAVTQHTEMQAVFLYSKVKKRGGGAPVIPECRLAKCYNVTLWGHIPQTLWMCAAGWAVPRQKKMGREL
jgi:hypothetical protein